uniref:Uncharacterized protein MANES_09G115600 n=1 Tax=Rhizophora mucronata TaxID=61149 RepID=A0A2P2PE19_RHIMU
MVDELKVTLQKQACEINERLDSNVGDGVVIIKI